MFLLDQTRTRQDPMATASAVVIYALLILGVGWAMRRQVHFAPPIKLTTMIRLAPPPLMPPAKALAGGGGGQRGPTPVSRGAPPKFVEQQITPPKAPVEAKIKMPDPAIEVPADLKMASNTMPNLGMPTSNITGSSMGNGRGTGMGSGSGAGLGPGYDGGLGGGLRKIGGAVSMPKVIRSVDPEFSEEARKAKQQGIVTIALIVDQNGMPRNPQVVQGIGMGLDEAAIKAILQYRFKPAMENGKPVAVALNYQVAFQIE